MNTRKLKSIYLIQYLLTSLTFIYSCTSSPKASDQVHTKSTLTAEEIRAKEIADSTELAEKEKRDEEFRRNQLNAELKNEMSYIESFDNNKYNENILYLESEVDYFSKLHNLIKQGQASSHEENSNLAKKLNAKLDKLQVKEYPIIRQRYARMAAKLLWENDIYVSSSGQGNRIINFTGAIFASNAGIKATYEKLYPILRKFRFKEVRFRWYKGQSEYTYYKLNTPSDKDFN